MNDRELTRRRLLELGLALPPVAALFAGADALVRDAEAAPLLTATPMIADADDPTPELTEGPYFTASSPLRRSIVPAGAAGTRFALSGRVLTTAGKPVADALIDFWQCDASGVYDNSGYRFRGHQFTDAKGRYALGTVVPGVYPGRTKHIHVKVQAPRRSVLTTSSSSRRERQPGRRHLHRRVPGDGLARGERPQGRALRLRARPLGSLPSSA